MGPAPFLLWTEISMAIADLDARREGNGVYPRLTDGERTVADVIEIVLTQRLLKA